jgi:hypothetical protein
MNEKMTRRNFMAPLVLAGLSIPEDIKSENGRLKNNSK